MCGSAIARPGRMLTGGFYADRTPLRRCHRRGKSSRLGDADAAATDVSLAHARARDWERDRRDSSGSFAFPTTHPGELFRLAGASFAKFERTIDPNPQNAPVYREARERWLPAYPPQKALVDAGVTEPMWRAPGLA